MQPRLHSDQLMVLLSVCAYVLGALLRTDPSNAIPPRSGRVLWRCGCDDRNSKLSVLAVRQHIDDRSTRCVARSMVSASITSRVSTRGRRTSDTRCRFGDKCKDAHALMVGVGGASSQRSVWPSHESRPSRHTTYLVPLSMPLPTRRGGSATSDFGGSQLGGQCAASKHTRSAKFGRYRLSACRRT